MAAELDKRVWCLIYLTYEPGDSRPLLAWHVPRARALERVLEDSLATNMYDGRATHRTAWYKMWTHASVVLPRFTIPFASVDPAWKAVSDPLVDMISREFAHSDRWSSATWLRAAQLAVDAHRPDVWRALRARVPESMWTPRFRLAWYCSRAWVAGPSAGPGPDKVSPQLLAVAK